MFSVIIPTYNRSVPLRNAIDSVLNQTFRDFELLVVDDGSTDSTPETVHEFGMDIIYIRQENSGVSAARNRGVRKSSFPCIAFLDSDDRWLPGKLEHHRLYMDRNPQINIHQTDETWIRKGKRVNPKTKHLKRGGHIFTDSLELCLISPSAVVMKRELFDTYGLFDELLPACEDYDLWLRITAHEEAGLIPESLVVRYGGHHDQLSVKHWGMDRFRLYSIMKLLDNEGESLSPLYASQAAAAALNKSKILLQGAQKRKNHEFADLLERIIQGITDGCYNRKDYQSLLKI